MSPTPELKRSSSQLRNDSLEKLRQLVRPLLINSDSSECNKNLSTYLKVVVDFLKDQPEVYHVCSILAVDLARSNLFLKNFQMAIGKILSLLHVLSEAEAACIDDVIQMKQFLLICLLIIFKLKDHLSPEALSTCLLKDGELLEILKALDFVKIISHLAANHLKESDTSHSSYVLLKFCCDIFFLYLYQVVLLTGEEFEALRESPLIPTLISDLLSNDNFNNYDVTGDDFEDEEKFLAYEEFKLLLLINEQFLMMSLSSNTSQNKVFEGLIVNRKNSVNGICGFTNLLVYHLNREESVIIKILMLKFLYLVFTTSYTSKLPYLNDVKILLDVILRELNDLDYSMDEPTENRMLAMTYLKVLYPLLLFSQLKDLQEPYKVADVVDTLRNVVVNCDEGSTDDLTKNGGHKEIDAIIKSAMKCLNVRWIKNISHQKNGLTKHPNSSFDSVSSLSSVSSRANNGTDSPLNDNLSFTRVASVRAGTKDDFNLHTTSHNLQYAESADSSSSMYSANNGNIFQTPRVQPGTFDHFEELASSHTEELLDIPKEFLTKASEPARSAPIPPSKGNRWCLQEKARLKKAPPPPPPPPRRRR